MAIEIELRRLEEKLLSPSVRTSKDALAELLADDFVEFGSSGRTFDKETIILDLQNEVSPPKDWSIRDFAIRELCRDVVLVTYGISVPVRDTDRVKSSLRCSIWVNRGGRWQMTFHQGTLVPNR